MKFEYHITEIECTDIIGIRAMLSQFGQDGWELVSASGLRHTGRTELAWSLGFFIFKRRIESLAQEIEAEESEARRVLIEKSRKVYQLIRPILIDGVAICTRGLCPQFDSALLKCKSASIEDDTAACSIWYERERQAVPQGTIRFVQEQFEPKSDDSESTKDQPDDPQMIQPLFIDDVAICTGGNCEQFDIVRYGCNLAEAVNHRTACPVWYKRKGKDAPRGIAQFIHDRESLCPEPESPSLVIKPLFLDCMAVCASGACPPQYVAVCASVGCPQFDSPNQRCKLDGELLDRGAACSVYYARRGRKQPEGVARFMQEGGPL